MEKRHAKGPSMAIATIAGSVGSGLAGGSLSGGSIEAVAAALGALAGVSSAVGGASLGALAGSAGTFLAQVAPLIGTSDNLGWALNSVSGDLFSSLYGSVGSSIGGISGLLLSIPTSGIAGSDSLVNSASNSLNSFAIGPLVNSFINLF